MDRVKPWSIMFLFLFLLFLPRPLRQLSSPLIWPQFHSCHFHIPLPLPLSPEEGPLLFSFAVAYQQTSLPSLLVLCSPCPLFARVTCLKHYDSRAMSPPQNHSGLSATGEAPPPRSGLQGPPVCPPPSISTTSSRMQALPCMLRPHLVSTVLFV